MAKRTAVVTGFVLIGLMTFALGTSIPKGEVNPTGPVGFTNTSAGDGERVLLDENFDGETLDKEVWNYCHWWNDDGCTISSNDELEWYLPSQVVLKDGTLQLIADPTTVQASDGKQYDYVSGMVTTGPATYQGQPKLAFTYGQVDVKFKVPAGQGLWPAIWLLPASGESRPEIDMLEVLGQTPNKLRITFHPKDRSAPEPSRYYVLPTGYGMADTWHTISLNWSHESLKFYLDGTTIWSLSSSSVPNEPMYLVMNLAVRGPASGSPNKLTRFPAVFEIDHVRITSNG